MSLCPEIDELCCDEHLLLHAQPVVEVAGGETVFEELLLRVRAPGGHVVGPGELLAKAEREGGIAAIDGWVLRRAAEIACGGRPVSVNVSAQSISDASFLATAERALDDLAADPRMLTLEITETALVSDLIQANRFAERLRSHGCSFALDDFGAGYAPMTYLKHLPLSYLKIDMSFVRDIVEDRRSQVLVTGIVGLAHAFGLRAVAEGVEDAATLDVVAALGVDLAQGYFTGAPRDLTGGGSL